LGKLSSAVHEKGNKIARAILEQLKATSIQYAVMYKGEIILSDNAGIYDKRGLRSLDKDVLYGVGSVSKVYVTAAAMLLVDKGQLDIDKPYNHYVPEFKMADGRYVKITSRMLMNHSSGIYGTHFKNSFLLEDTDTSNLDSLLDNLSTCKLKHEPGMFSEYCNDGFQLLELLVERISGMKYNEYLSKFFFEPLGISNTKTANDYYDRTKHARFYMPVCDGAQPVETTNLLGTGGIISTAEDMCRFGQVLMGKKILSEASAKTMAQKEYLNGMWHRDPAEDNLFAYGLGWDQVHVPPFNKLGIQALCKGGDTMHYHASLICIPEHDLVAASASSGAASFLNYMLVIELLLEALKENGIINEFPAPRTFTPPTKVDMPDELLKYQGIYGSSGKFLNIEIKDGEFVLPAMLSLIPEQKYVYAGDGKFVSPDGTVSAFFAEERNGLTFLQTDAALSFPEIGTVLWKAFGHQKLDPNPIDGRTAAAWENRRGKTYLLCDDKYTSPRYMSASPVSHIELSVNSIGYAFGGCRIADENYAENVLYFRDVIDFRLRAADGVEYLDARGNAHIREDFIPKLKADETTVTIAENGYVQYFKIDGDAVGKTITVQLPKASAFAAYNEKGEYKNLSTITGNNTVELANNDLIAFIGSPGAEFKITLQ